jgi:hypothetical protein
MKVLGNLDISPGKDLNSLIGKEVVLTDVDWYQVFVCTIVEADNSTNMVKLSSGDWVCVNSLHYFGD